jgi:hypothetical protein
VLGDLSARGAAIGLPARGRRAGSMSKDLFAAWPDGPERLSWPGDRVVRRPAQMDPLQRF